MRDGIAEGLQFLVGFLPFPVQFFDHLQLVSLRLVVKGQLDKDAHLGFEHLRDDRQEEIIHRAKAVTVEPVQLRRARSGDENDRRFFETRPAADQLGELEAVHLRHVHVQQNDREIASQQALERLPTGGGLDDVLAQFRQDRLMGQQVARLVVHQENVRLLRRTRRGRQGGIVAARNHSGSRSLFID